MKINSKKVEMVLADRCMLYTDLAKKSNLSPFTITRMRTGAEVNPSTVGKIAKALGVTVQELKLQLLISSTGIQRTTKTKSERKIEMQKIKGGDARCRQ